MENTQRFSSRVNDYVKYRPGYPAEIPGFLQDKYQLTIDKLIADIGAGTGISSELFLKAGYAVIAVEPNAEMRQKAIELLQPYDKFTAVDGTAEQTTLENSSVDAIIAGQAFHWFNAEATRQEFKRILKPAGIVALIWNERKTASVFEKEYDALIVKHAVDYLKVDHRNIDAAQIAAFFSPADYTLTTFDNYQVFDFEGLLGRLSSSSYMPNRDDAGYEAVEGDLRILFDKYQRDGKVTIEYDTKVYSGII